MLRSVLKVLGTLRYECDIKASEMLSFFRLKNNSVTVGLYRLPYLPSHHQRLFSNTFLFFVGL